MNSSERKITKKELKNLESSLNQLWTDYGNINILEKINKVSISKKNTKTTIKKYQRQSLQFVDKFNDNKKFNLFDINEINNNIIRLSHNIIIGIKLTDLELNKIVEDYLFPVENSISRITLIESMDNLKNLFYGKLKEIDDFLQDIKKAMEGLTEKKKFEIINFFDVKFYKNFPDNQELIDSLFNNFYHLMESKEYLFIDEFKKDSEKYKDIRSNFLKPIFLFLNIYNSEEINKLKVLLMRSYSLEFKYVELTEEEEKELLEKEI